MPPEVILVPEKLEFKKGKHTYAYDPSGYKTPDDGYDRFPVFRVDDTPISVDMNLSVAYEGCTYFVCGCKDYQEREKRYDQGESYKRFQNDPQFGWDCIATCQHIILLKRNFQGELIRRALEEAKKRNLNESRALAELLRSAEGEAFPSPVLAHMITFQKALEARVTK